MKKLLLLATTVLLTASTYAQDDMEAMQTAWMEYMQPGEVHQLLASYNGEWKADMTMYMPGSEPMKMQSTATFEMVMDGRFQKGTYAGDMMGMPFEGVSTVGYNNARQMFESTWMDNSGTGITYSEGKWDARTRTIEFKGMMTDPMTKTTNPFREVVTLTDENTHKMEMYETKEGKETKTMEINFTRI